MAGTTHVPHERCEPDLLVAQFVIALPARHFAFGFVHVTHPIDTLLRKLQLEIVAIGTTAMILVSKVMP